MSDEPRMTTDLQDAINHGMSLVDVFRQLNDPDYVDPRESPALGVARETYRQTSSAQAANAAYEHYRANHGGE